MNLLLDILGVVLLLLACGVTLIALALTMPVRIGVEAHGDGRLDGGSGTLRLFGGALGAGARVDRGTRRDSSRLRLIVGLMIWRWFIPVYRTYVGGEAEPSVAPERDRADRPDDNVTEQPDTPAEDAPGLVDTERQAPSTTAPLDRQTSALPTPVDEPSETVASGVDASVSSTDDSDARANRADQADSAPSMLERFRDARNEWWPVVRGVWRRLGGLIRVRRFHIDGTIGLDDPALTGQVVGLALSLRGLSAPSGTLAILGIDRGALRINVDPVFEQCIIAGRIEAEWRISLRRIWSAAIYVGWVLLQRKLAQRRLVQRKRRNAHDTMEHERAPGGYEPSKN